MGDSVGLTVGSIVGTRVGEIVGDKVGERVGCVIEEEREQVSKFHERGDEKSSKNCTLACRVGYLQKEWAPE